MASLIPAVSLVNGIPRVSSLAIADHFQKNHQHVLRDIRSLTAELPDDFTASNFGLSDYLDPTGRTLPAYNLSRDGFTLVAMGFTGSKALQWKIRYIQAFNAMEAELARRTTLPESIADELRHLRARQDRLEQQLLKTQSPRHHNVSQVSSVTTQEIETLLKTRLDWKAPKNLWSWRTITQTLVECGFNGVPARSESTRAGLIIRNITGQRPRRPAGFARLHCLPPPLCEDCIVHLGTARKAASLV